jgi:CBS domain-containing protein
MAATLLAVELLLFEWRPRSFIPVAIAATVAGVLRGSILGHAPIFPVPLHGHLGLAPVALSFAVGTVSGLGSIGLTALVYGFEDLFHKLPVHWMWWPVLGGLAVGLGGWFEPRALGVGYASIHGLLQGQDLGGALGRLFLIKGLIWSLSLGSGTSGGVLAPLLILGGTLGALEARVLPVHDAGLWAMVGMASMMGGTMRSPLTAIVFALELTHDASALPALLAGCVAAHAVTVLFLRRSILTEKLARRGYHLSREYGVDPMQLARVGEIMDPHLAVIPPDMTVSELSARVSGGDAELSRHHALPIADGSGALLGIITRGDMVRALGRPGGAALAVLEAGTRKPATAFPDETLDEAAGKMLLRGVGRLLVVRRNDPSKVIGYLGRSALLASRLRGMDEERVREGMWSVAFPFRKAR